MDDDHSSSPVIADGIEQPTRKRRRAVCQSAFANHAPLFGLAPCGVLPAIRVATNAVRSYRTFSPLPFDSAFRPCSGRYIFCATSPSSCPDRALPGALPCGVRTFLAPFSPRSSSALRRLYYPTFARFPSYGGLAVRFLGNRVLLELLV